MLDIVYDPSDLWCWWMFKVVYPDVQTCLVFFFEYLLTCKCWLDLVLELSCCERDLGSVMLTGFKLKLFQRFCSCIMRCQSVKHAAQRVRSSSISGWRYGHRYLQSPPSKNRPITEKEKQRPDYAFQHGYQINQQTTKRKTKSQSRTSRLCMQAVWCSFAGQAKRQRSASSWAGPMAHRKRHGPSSPCLAARSGRGAASADRQPSAAARSRDKACWSHQEDCHRVSDLL